MMVCILADSILLRLLIFIDYEIPAHPPRVPSPFGPRRVSVDELDIRSR